MEFLRQSARMLFFFVRFEMLPTHASVIESVEQTIEVVAGFQGVIDCHDDDGPVFQYAPFRVPQKAHDSTWAHGTSMLQRLISLFL